MNKNDEKIKQIISFVNDMISNPAEIHDVFRRDTQLFFMFGKSKWSIVRHSDADFNLYMYPIESMTLQQAAEMKDRPGFKGFVKYNTVELKSKEVLVKFKTLSWIVSDKFLGIDKTWTTY